MSQSMWRARRRIDRVLDNDHVVGLVHGARQATRDAGLHRLTTTMVVASVLVLFGVPHIRALLLPPVTTFERVIYGVSLVSALLFYSLAWFGTLPIDDIRRAKPELLGTGTGWYAWLYTNAQWAGRWLDRLLDRAHGSRAVTGALFIVALAFLTLRSDSPPVIVNVLVLCAWLLVQSFDVPWPIGEPEHRAAGAVLVGRTVTMLLIANLGVECVWWIEGLLREHQGTYSIWAVFQTLFAITLLVRMIDVLGLLELLGSPVVRFVWALAALAFLALFPAGTRVGEVIEARAAAESPSVGALLSPTSRALADVEPDHHAWLRALDARLTEMPEGQPAIVVAASGGGSRAAMTASLVFDLLDRTPRPDFLAERGSLADNVLIVSSVSGGSLATAYFYTHEPDPGAVERRDSAFVRAMGRDYMAPLLRGVLHIAQERGDAVASFWREWYGWQDVFDDTPRTAGRPLVVLNGTDVKLGMRVAFGFPALPEGSLEPSKVAADIGKGLRLNLADAVRISANFPYGFDHVVFGEESHELIDGGVVDNTGLDTLALLLEGLQRPSDADDGSGQLAVEVFQKLEARGLIILEIDAGARPSQASFLARQFPSLTKPLEALGRSAHHNSAILRRGYLERIAEALEPTAVGLVRAGPNCDVAGDVITAWALDSADRDRIIYRDFAGVEPSVSTQLALQVETIACLQAQQRMIEVATLEGRPTGAVEDERNRLVGHYTDFQDRAREHAALHHLCADQVPESFHDAVMDAAKRVRHALDRSVIACGRGAGPSGEGAPEETLGAEPLAAQDHAEEAEQAEEAADESAAEVEDDDKPVAVAKQPVPPKPRASSSGSKAAKADAGGDKLPVVDAAREKAPTTKSGTTLAVLDRRALEVMLNTKPDGSTAQLERSVSLKDARIPKELLQTKAKATRTRVLGWVYLGALEGKGWETRYASWQGNAVPGAGDEIMLTGTSHVRTAIPDERGALAPSRMTLPGKTRLIVLATEDWGDAGFIWARVATQD